MVDQLTETYGRPQLQPSLRWRFLMGRTFLNNASAAAHGIVVTELLGGGLHTQGCRPFGSISAAGWRGASRI